MAPRKNYTPEQMGKAIDAVRKGEKVATAARRFGVPRITLHDKLSGKTQINCTMGPSTVLSKMHEEILEKWLITMPKKRFPICKDSLLDSVQKIIIDQNITNPFSDNRPGKKWYQAFLKRHPNITERIPENLSIARDNVSEKDIRNWFEEVDSYLEENNLKDILKDPNRIFNADESAFFLSPKPGPVLAQKGEKHLYTSCGDDKENLTVLFTGNAAGVLAPPMIVFNYERVPTYIASTVPEDWAIGKSESGWMCSSTFYEYVVNIFNPWLEQNKIQKPIIFFIDGHKSHLTLHLSNFCSEHGIEVVALYPNSTHLLQPMDLAVFRPLKLFWKKTVNEWKMTNLGQNVKKQNFAPLLKKAIAKLTPDCIKNGFRAGGLFPFGPDYIDMSKIKNRKGATKSDPASTEFIKYLETEIMDIFSKEKLTMFQNLFYKKRETVESDLPEEDTSLYIIWAKNKTKCHSDFCETSSDIRETSEVIQPFNTHQKESLTSPKRTDTREQSPFIIDRDFEEVNKNFEVGDFNTFQRVIENIPNQTSTITEPPSPSILQLPGDSSVTESNDIPEPEIISTANSQSAVDNTTMSSIISENRPLFLTPERPPHASISETIHTDKITPIKKTLDDALGITVPSPFKKFLFWPEDDVNKKNKRIKKEKIPAAVTSKAWREYHEKKENEKKRQQKEKEERARKRQEKKMMKDNNADMKKKTISKKNKKKNSGMESSSEESNLEIEFAESDCSYAEDDDRENLINKISKSINCQPKPLKRKTPATPTNIDSDFDMNVSCSLSTLAAKKRASKTGQTNKITSGCYVIVTYENEYFPGKIEKVEKNQFEVSTMVLSMGNTFRWPEKTDKIWYSFDQIIEKIDTPVRLNNRGFYKIKEMQKYLPDIYN